MKNAAILAASFAMAHLVGAVPVNKRDVVYTTTTEEVWETFWSTTTIWVDPLASAAAPSSSSPGGFFEVQSSTPSVASAVVPTSSSAPVSSAPAYSAVAAQIAPVSSAPAPSPTSTSVYVAPYVAPVVSTTSTTPVPTYVAPTPTPAPVTPTSVYVPPAVVSSAAPAAVSAASSSGSTTGDFTGDMTYYDVSVGLGSCGVSGSNSQNLVAINAPDMANGINPNLNPHCGKTINIYYNGATHTATVFDTCPACAAGAIDVTNELFLKVAPDGNGRVHGVSWSWA